MMTRLTDNPILIGVLALALMMSNAVVHADMLSSTRLQQAVDQAYHKYKDLKDGKNADYIPILATVPSDLFGIVIVTREGKVYARGDVDYKFSIQSVSKPFTASLVMQQQGPGVLAEKIGVEPTGLPFNSKMALELLEARSANPSVNAGAIANLLYNYERLFWPATAFVQ
jgi:glutaminase